jgi:hypothetical protein
MRIRDLFVPGSGILDEKIRIRDPRSTSRIRNTALKEGELCIQAFLHLQAF